MLRSPKITELQAVCLNVYQLCCSNWLGPLKYCSASSSRLWSISWWPLVKLIQNTINQQYLIRVSQSLSSPGNPELCTVPYFPNSQYTSPSLWCPSYQIKDFNSGVSGVRKLCFRTSRTSYYNQSIPVQRGTTSANQILGRLCFIGLQQTTSVFWRVVSRTLV